MRISKGKFRVLHLGRSNFKHQYELVATQQLSRKGPEG